MSVDDAGSGDPPPWMRAGATIVDELDSVDAQFAGEFSEETRALMKEYEKPKWLEEESSLDPVGEMEEYAEHGLRLPPRTHDAMEDVVRERVAELREAAAEQLSPEEAALVRYRKALVDGTPGEELKLLKLRAYHRAMDAKRAHHAAAVEGPEARRKLMEAHGVPLDAVPLELIDMTPEQLAERWAAAQGSDAGPRTCNGDALGAYSDESEWAADWAASDYLTSAAGHRDLQAMLAEPARTHAPVRSAPVPQVGEALLHGDPARYQRYTVVHGYTPEYKEQQLLQRQLRNQQRQRALAFWLPLGSVLGLYVVKGLRSMLKSRRERQELAKKKQTKKRQAVIS